MCDKYIDYAWGQKIKCVEKEDCVGTPYESMKMCHPREGDNWYAHNGYGAFEYMKDGKK